MAGLSGLLGVVVPVTYIDKSKIFAHLDRIAGWEQGKRYAPVTVELDLSNRCYLGCESCFTSDTIVATRERGPVSIADVTPGDHVLGYDETTDALTWTLVEAVSARPYVGPLVTASLDNATIRATANHPFLTQRGWIDAIELTDRDHLRTNRALCLWMRHADQESEVPVCVGAREEGEPAAVCVRVRTDGEDTRVTGLSWTRHAGNEPLDQRVQKGRSESDEAAGNARRSLSASSRQATTKNLSNAQADVCRWDINADDPIRGQQRGQSQTDVDIESDAATRGRREGSRQWALPETRGNSQPAGSRTQSAAEPQQSRTARVGGAQSRHTEASALFGTAAPAGTRISPTDFAPHEDCESDVPGRHQGEESQQDADSSRTVETGTLVRSVLPQTQRSGMVHGHGPILGQGQESGFQSPRSEICDRSDGRVLADTHVAVNRELRETNDPALRDARLSVLGRDVASATRPPNGSTESRSDPSGTDVHRHWREQRLEWRGLDRLAVSDDLTTVYNLQTQHGTYLANGVVVHNCHFAHTHVRGPWATKERRLPMAYDGIGDLADLTVLGPALTEMALAGVRGVIWSGGGEPTTHPQWLDAVARADRAGLEQGMYTAGGLLNPHSAKALATKAKFVVVSLDT